MCCNPFQHLKQILLGVKIIHRPVLAAPKEIGLCCWESVSPSKDGDAVLPHPDTMPILSFLGNGTSQLSLALGWKLVNDVCPRIDYYYYRNIPIYQESQLNSLNYFQFLHEFWLSPPGPLMRSSWPLTLISLLSLF